jgi:hypothetical protein
VCLGLLCLGLLSSLQGIVSLQEAAGDADQGNRNAVVYHSPGLADRGEAYPGNRTTQLRRSRPQASIKPALLRDRNYSAITRGQ